MEFAGNNDTLCLIFDLDHYGTPELVGQVLNEMIAATSQMGTWLRHDGKWWYFYRYQVRLKSGEIIEEKEFFELVVKSKQHDEKIVEYIRQIILNHGPYVWYYTNIHSEVLQ